MKVEETPIHLLLVLLRLSLNQDGDGNRTMVYSKLFIHKFTRSLTHSSTHFLKILHSVYGSIESCVKINLNTVTASLPVLFSLYMNDIPNLLTDKKCISIKLEDQNINCLMYADDLTLISTSANDLQHSLDVLEEHANNWKLKINVKKSSIIIP